MQSMSVEDPLDLDRTNGAAPLSGPLSRPAQSQRVDPAHYDSSSDEIDSKTGLGIPQIAVGLITLALAAAFVVTSGALPGGGTSSGSQVVVYTVQIRNFNERTSLDLPGQKKREKNRSLSIQIASAELDFCGNNTKAIITVLVLC